MALDGRDGRDGLDGRDGQNGLAGRESNVKAAGRYAVVIVLLVLVWMACMVGALPADRAEFLSYVGLFSTGILALPEAIERLRK